MPLGMQNMRIVNRRTIGLHELHFKILFARLRGRDSLLYSLWPQVNSDLFFCLNVNVGVKFMLKFLAKENIIFALYTKRK